MDSAHYTPCYNPMQPEFPVPSYEIQFASKEKEMKQESWEFKARPVNSMAHKARSYKLDPNFANKRILESKYEGG